MPSCVGDRAAHAAKPRVHGSTMWLSHPANLLAHSAPVNPPLVGQGALDPPASGPGIGPPLSEARRAPFGLLRACAVEFAPLHSRRNDVRRAIRVRRHSVVARQPHGLPGHPLCPLPRERRIVTPGGKPPSTPMQASPRPPLRKLRASAIESGPLRPRRNHVRRAIVSGPRVGSSAESPRLPGEFVALGFMSSRCGRRAAGCGGRRWPPVPARA